MTTPSDAGCHGGELHGTADRVGIVLGAHSHIYDIGSRTGYSITSVGAMLQKHCSMR